jgi:hypothetical protein
MKSAAPWSFLSTSIKALTVVLSDTTALLHVTQGTIFAFWIAKFSDATLFQYENTAVLTYKDRSRGWDKGKPFQGYGSNAIVMTRTAQGWRVVADIVGADPPEPQQTDESKK